MLLSCEQIACASHPPFLTWQLSKSNGKKIKDESCSTVSWGIGALYVFIPVHVTPAPAAVLVKPVLQIQPTAFVVGSCMQMEFASQPPLLTLQASTNINERVIAIRFFFGWWPENNYLCRRHSNPRQRIRNRSCKCIAQHCLTIRASNRRSGRIRHCWLGKYLWRSKEKKINRWFDQVTRWTTPPVQVTLEAEPVLLYPVLHVHTTA